MIKNPSRRNFLRTASAATVAGLAVSEIALSSPMAAQTSSETPESKVYTGNAISGMLQAIQAAPGSKTLFAAGAIPLSVVYTHEVKKSSKEFEYHESRHHIFQIIEGSTRFDLGGTPQGGHHTAAHPKEWHAPSSPGSNTVTLNKGDMLVVPKNTPHRRSTDDSVIFSLTSFEV